MSSGAQDPYFLAVLKRELTRRCQKNSKYSLRAFATSLDSDVGYLSRILSGKRLPSYKRGDALSASLRLSPRERNRFIESITDARKQSALGALSTISRSQRTKPTALENDLYDQMAALHNLALLELTFVDNFQGNVRWMARQLGISHFEARIAVDRMKRLGLMTEIDGAIQATNTDTTTGDKSKTSAALKIQQKDILTRAMRSLSEDPIAERSMSGMTMAIDPEKIPLAKVLIQDFMEELAATLGQDRKSRVYQLGISLYPLQRKKSSNAKQAI